MTPLPRKNTAPEGIRLYKSLGKLIKDYRQWQELSQEAFAAAIGISVRALQNWEADRHRARIDNLHDLSEVAGIPMQVCVALNAEQPLWYSLRERRFAYSAAETVNYSLDELFNFRENTDDGIITKAERISTDRHIHDILACHRDIYGTEKSLAKDVIKAASLIAPALNLIVFDSWGHYVGHHVSLPLNMDVYQQLKTAPSFETYLTAAKVSDILALPTGVFFMYSVFAASWNVGHVLLIDTAPYYARVKETGNYLVSGHAATKDVSNCHKINFTLSKMMGVWNSSIPHGIHHG